MKPQEDNQKFFLIKVFGCCFRKKKESSQTLLQLVCSVFNRKKNLGTLNQFKDTKSVPKTIMEHADLVAEMTEVEQLSTQDRLHLARL